MVLVLRRGVRGGILEGVVAVEGVTPAILAAVKNQRTDVERVFTVKKLVAYYRVSTEKQGRSGLGLDAQKTAVADYARSTGAEIVKEYTEIESGRKTDRERPELLKALAHVRRSQGLLCIAKIDRLSRRVSFLSSLMDSGSDFVACDNPQANRLTIHILVAVAEDEARRISERTKAALAAYLVRGGKLGSARPECRNLTARAAERGRRLGADAVKKLADEAYSDLYPTLLEKRAAGMSLHAIACWLNAEGYVTRRGKPWRKMQVKLVLDRARRVARLL